MLSTLVFLEVPFLEVPFLEVPRLDKGCEQQDEMPMQAQENEVANRKMNRNGDSMQVLCCSEKSQAPGSMADVWCANSPRRRIVQEAASRHQDHFPLPNFLHSTENL
jgi:hypothetical protein